MLVVLSPPLHCFVVLLCVLCVCVCVCVWCEHVGDGGCCECVGVGVRVVLCFVVFRFGAMEEVVVAWWQGVCVCMVVVVLTNTKQRLHTLSC